MSSVTEIIHNPSLKTIDAKGVDIVLPFVNAKYRTRIRVVDFFPHNLEEFARSMADPDWHTALQKSDLGEMRQNTRWEWGFVLLVENANVAAGTTPERLRLFVNNPAGQHLLNMNASE
jgi:protection-of-telomeres protein 1